MTLSLQVNDEEGRELFCSNPRVPFDFDFEALITVIVSGVTETASYESNLNG